jgi:MFS family permease
MNLPVCAKISDTYGRRQVFLYTTILSVVAFLVFTLDALWLLGDWAILITAPLMATNAPHQVVMWSMFVDMVSDPIDQASFFPFVASIEGVAPLIGDFLSYFILRAHVSDCELELASLHRTANLDLYVNVSLRV